MQNRFVSLIIDYIIHIWIAIYFRGGYVDVCNDTQGHRAHANAPDSIEHKCIVYFSSMWQTDKNSTDDIATLLFNRLNLYPNW